MIRIGTGFILLGALLLITLFLLKSLPGTQKSSVAEMAGDWMIENQNEYFIHAEYKPYTLEYPSSAHPLGEMQAMWALSELGVYSGKNKYTELAEKGFSFFERALVVEPEKDFAYFNITPQKVHLGYNSFALLTLLNIDHKKKEEYLEKIADGILTAQSIDGSLKPYLFSSRNTEKDTFPGQAMFALMQLYQETENEDYLLAVQKAIPSSLQLWKNTKSVDLVLWNMQAYALFLEKRQHDETQETLVDMATWILDQHPSPNGCSTFSFSLGLEEAKHIHAMAAAIPALQKITEKEQYICYTNFVSEGLASLLHLQIRKPGEMEERARGGFLESTGKNKMRTTGIQEALMAFLSAAKIGVQ